MPYLFKARFSVIAVIKSTYSGGPVLKTPVSTVGGTSSVPGWETKIPHAIQLKKEICFLNKEIYKLKKKKHVYHLKTCTGTVTQQSLETLDSAVFGKLAKDHLIFIICH